MAIRYSRITLVCLTALVFLSSPALPAFGQWLYPRPRAQFQVKPPDSILVRFKPGYTHIGARRLLSLSASRDLPKMTLRREIPKLGILVYRLQHPTSMAVAVVALKRMREVLYAEPAHRIILLADPDDPYFNKNDLEHSLFDNVWKYQWPLHTIEATAAWGIWPNKYYTSANKPRDAPKLAVIDTGIDTSHPDYANKGGTSKDARTGGQLDLEFARNFVNGGDNPAPNDPTDDFGHG